MAIEALFLLVNSETQTKQKSIQVLKVTYNARSGFFKNLKRSVEMKAFYVVITFSNYSGVLNMY